MRDRALGVALLALVGASGWFVVSGSNGPSAGVAVSTNADSTKKTGAQAVLGKDCDDPVYRLLCDYYATSSAAEVHERFRSDAGTSTPGPGRIIVATVPDPRDSHVGYSFDEGLDAIRLAMVRADYQPDRFYLPWTAGPREREQSTETTDDENTKYEMTVPGTPIANQRTESVKGTRKEILRGLPATRPGQEWPGALLFRKRNDAPVLILLVGETPTYGVQSRAFATALQYVKLLDADWDKAWILGPSFSGSADSIRRGINAYGCQARVISGTATSPVVGEVLRRGQSSFASLSRDDDDIGKAVKNYLPAALREKSVLLRESDTAYGQGIVSDENRCPSSDGPFATEIPYPINISEIAAAFAARGLFDADSLPRLRTEEGRSLPLAFGISGEPVDVPPVLFPEKASREAALALTATFDSIRREGVSLVGIVGTNAYDKLFLAKLVRQHAPSVQLLLYDSDAIYTHPSHLADMHGAWIVSSYPNAPSTQRWPRGGAGSRLYFTGSRTEGLYNATLALLAERQQRPELVKRMVDYWHSDGKGNMQPGPAVWLTAVGRSEAWPIKQLDTTGSLDCGPPLPTGASPNLWAPTADPSDQQGPALAVSYPDLQPASFFVAMSAFGLLALLWCWVYAKTDDYGFRTIRWLVHERGDHARLPLFVALVLFTSVLSGFAFASYHGSVQWFHEVRLAPFDWNRMRATPAIAVFALTIVALLLVCARLTWRLTPAPVLDRFVCLVWILDLGLMLARVAFPSFALDPYDTITKLRSFTPRLEDIWRYERAVTLSSGLSPILPAVFFSIACAVAAHSAGRTMRLLQFWRSVAAFAPRRSEMAGLVSVVGQRLIWRPQAHSWISGFMFFIALCFMIIDHLFTLEGPGFGLAISAGIVVLPVVFTEFALHALGIWRALRRVLRALAAGPLAEAFDRLPPERARNIGLRLSSDPGFAPQIRRSLDQWTLIWSDRRQVAKIRQYCEAELAGSVAQSRWLYCYELRSQALLSRLARRLMQGMSDPTSVVLNLESSTSSALPLKRDDGTALDGLASYRRHLGTDTLAQRIAEDFAAEQVLQFVSYVFVHIRNALACAVYGSILLVLAVASYPFQPQQTLMRICLTVLLGSTATVFGIIVLVDRNELLSRVANRTPNKVDFDGDLLSQMVTYVLVPLAAVVATQFPGLGHVVAELLNVASR